MSAPDLRARASIEDAVAGYEEVVAAVCAAVDAAAGEQGWTVRANGGTAGCAEAPGSGGLTRTLDLRHTTTTLAEDGWARAVAAAVAVAATAGFGPAEVVVDRPVDHEVRMVDGLGALLVLGAGRRTTLTLSTGCHLPAALLG